MIFVHNHPSGVVEPSEANITLTRRLHAALNTGDIRVLVHLVLAEQNAVSLAERRLTVYRSDRSISGAPGTSQYALI
ncbi:MAG: JAB domain-containing protein [Pseudomonadota bacterium]|nr:JAB domain-containing protein [Pseudomonadota bacterium]